MTLKVNEYHEGSVKSIALDGAHGRATVGVMLPGAYDFSTTSVEVMTVIDGELTVRLPGTERDRTFRSGQSFEVGAGQRFYLAVRVPTAYHCLYRP